MKRIFNYITIVILASASIISCDSFLDQNTDPTRLKVALVPQVLTSGQAGLGFYMGSDIFLYSSIFMQQASGSGVTGSQTRFMDQYIVANADVNNAFSNFYAGNLADLNYVRQNAALQGNPNHAGIAKVLQAFTFSILVDAWGDVPYKDVLKGKDNLQPVYNNSQEIYDSLFLLVDNGIADLKLTNATKVASEDLIYTGDLNKWIRFANTLKLRMALHYANVDGGAKLKALISSGASFMQDRNDNFQLAFENVTNRQNPIQQFELQRADYYAAGKFIIDLMNTKNDPRRASYFTPIPYDAATAAYKGFDQGSTQSAPNSRIGTYLRGAVLTSGTARTAQGAPTATAITYNGTAPLRMLTFAEYNFIMAEAILSYGATSGSKTADDFYKAGVEASLNDAALYSTAITPLSIVTYLGTLAPVTLKTLIEEKYVANYGVAVEPWTDWRRTGFPVIPVSLAAITQGNNTIPRILVYPLSEQQANGINVPARVSMSVKGTFWDK